MKFSAVVLTLTFCVVCAVAQGPVKNPPAMPPLPIGFTDPPNSQNGKSPWRASGMGDQMEGIKKNDLSVCFGNPKFAHLSYSWFIGGQQMIIDAILRGPEKPAFQDPLGHRDEPAGKMAYRGGVLEMRRIIYLPDIGIDMTGKCNNATLDTYDITWTGVAAGKMLAIEVHLFAGSNNEARATIDGLIDPLKATATSAK